MTDNLSNNSPILSNSLSDNEIKKALEMCAERIICLVPYEDNGTQFYQLSVGYILDLINRLQAEIERLKKELTITRAHIHDNGLEWDLLSYSKRIGG